MRGIYGLSFRFYRLYNSFLAVAISADILSFALFLDLFVYCVKSDRFQMDIEIFFLLKATDTVLTLIEHCKSRCLNSAHIQRSVVELGKKSCGIDTDNPIRLCTAESRLIEIFVILAVPEIIKAVTDSLFFH